ncbi:hypothetical protein BG262_04605 [Floricoccus penangensis]|uniref:HTH cro/C1-type domain-containing protein n=1 Tax=Floricoccus penangensis TaxID=1859475 RepID=A0A9Q5JFK1_9LACT|nr:Rgg/GadR/MutR family transcriptional regulator [Floricoccus penangensis]OFI46301.1 hypothetical protein BG262_04605 [Floricoccus penangensis]
MKMTNEELGIFFREIRKARKLTLKDISDQNITAAQLSKFERGISNLTFDRLFSVIDSLNMSIEEFAYAMNGYELNNFQSFIMEIENAYDRKDEFHLLKMKEQLFLVENATTDDRIKRVLVESHLWKLNWFLKTDYKVNRQDAKYVADYLMSIDEWTNYEVYLFNEIIYFISIDTVNVLAREMIFRNSFYQDILENKKTVLICLLNIYNVMIHTGNKDTSRFFRKKIKEILPSNSNYLYEKISFDCSKAIEDYVFNESQDGLVKIKKIIGNLEELGLHEFSSQLEYDLKNIINHYSKGGGNPYDNSD